MYFFMLNDCLSFFAHIKITINTYNLNQITTKPKQKSDKDIVTEKI